MTTYEIEYIKTGSGETKKTDRVWINTGDEMLNGKRVNNITDAIEHFEELAEHWWATCENRNAIINIKAL